MRRVNFLHCIVCIYFRSDASVLRSMYVFPIIGITAETRSTIREKIYTGSFYNTRITNEILKARFFYSLYEPKSMT